MSCFGPVIPLLPRALELEVCLLDPEEPNYQLQKHKQHSKKDFHNNPFL